jgi:16S rRNA (uracil1498-N3)-methyltransferase
MHIPRVYLDQELNCAAHIKIGDAQAHHLLNVLRIKASDPLILFNGRGGEYQAKVTERSKQHLLVEILEFNPVNRESSLKIHLLMSLLKRDKMNQAITRAVELGVSEITPVRTDNASISIKQEKSSAASLQQTVQSAAEQCGRTQLPILQPGCLLAEAVAGLQPGLKLVAEAGQPRLSSYGYSNPRTLTLLIGPEGGLSQQELAFLIERDFHPFGFGARTLRAETAPAALLALLQQRWADH